MDQYHRDLSAPVSSVPSQSGIWIEANPLAAWRIRSFPGHVQSCLNAFRVNISVLLGALLAISNKFSFLKLKINKEQCNQCGRCHEECPMGIDPVTAERDVECIRCLECMDTCAKPEGIELRVL